MHAEAPADDDLEEEDEVDDEGDDYEEEKPAAKKAKGAAGKAAGGKKGGQAAKGILFMYFLKFSTSMYFLQYVFFSVFAFLNSAQEHTGAALFPLQESENRLLWRDKTCHAAIPSSS